MGAARVIASRRQHPAGVRADVPRPRLRDVQGAVFVETDAGAALRAQGGPVLLPDVPEGKEQWSEKRGREVGGPAGAQPGAGLEPSPKGSRALPRRHRPPGADPRWEHGVCVGAPAQPAALRPCRRALCPGGLAHEAIIPPVQV